MSRREAKRPLNTPYPPRSIEVLEGRNGEGKPAISIKALPWPQRSGAITITDGQLVLDLIRDLEEALEHLDSDD